MHRDLFCVAMEELTRGTNVQFVINDESTYENTEWISEDVPKPSREVVMAKLKDLQDAEPMRILRIKRKKVLADTDKYMTIDYPMTDEEKLSMREYRQVLRDLPQNDLTEIPEPPESIKKFV